MFVCLSSNGWMIVWMHESDGNFVFCSVLLLVLLLLPADVNAAAFIVAAAAVGAVVWIVSLLVAGCLA